MRLQQSIAGQLKKRKELLYNLGAISSYASMLTFFWHGVSMLGCQGASLAHLGYVRLADIFYECGDGSLRVGQKVDEDQNLDLDVGVWLVTVDLFVQPFVIVGEILLQFHHDFLR